METQDSKGKIVKETFPSEVVSILGDILAGTILLLLILPFHSFLILIVMIPALLSLRGNISGPFIARTSRDLIIGEFNKKSWAENVFATYLLSLITAFLIGILSIFLVINIFKMFTLPPEIILMIPIISILVALSISIPCSTTLNYLSFKYGLNPNNVVNPIMTAIDDIFTVISFYLTIIILGVP
ncbi:MAG: magnesium transporter [Promethearchaeota archaeon]